MESNFGSIDPHSSCTSVPVLVGQSQTGWVSDDVLRPDRERTNRSHKPLRRGSFHNPKSSSDVLLSVRITLHSEPPTRALISARSGWCRMHRRSKYTLPRQRSSETICTTNIESSSRTSAELQQLEPISDCALRAWSSGKAASDTKGTRSQMKLECDGINPKQNALSSTMLRGDSPCREDLR